MVDSDKPEKTDQRLIYFTCAGCGENLNAPVKDATKIRKCTICGESNKVPFPRISISREDAPEVQEGKKASISDNDEQKKNIASKSSEEITPPVKHYDNTTTNLISTPTRQDEPINHTPETIEAPQNNINANNSQPIVEPPALIKNNIADETHIIPAKGEDNLEPNNIDSSKKKPSRSYQYLIIFALFFSLGFLGFKYQYLTFSGSNIQESISDSSKGDKSPPSNTSGDNSSSDDDEGKSAPPFSPQLPSSTTYSNITDQEKAILEKELSSIWTDFNKSVDSAKSYKSLKSSFQIDKSLGVINPNTGEELINHQTIINEKMLSAGISYKEIYNIYKDNPEGVTDFLNSSQLNQGDNFSNLLLTLPKMFQIYKADDLAIKEFWRDNFKE